MSSILSSTKPGVHPAVDDGVVHGVTHRQPVDDQVDWLGPAVVNDLLVAVRDDEENVLG